MTEIHNRDLTEIFPDYIAFGILDFDSLKLDSDHARAIYRSKKGDVVYDIKIYKDSCVVDEFFKGKLIGMTRFKTIEKAFQQKFMACEWREHPRFVEIVERFATVNVTFPGTFKNELKCAYFPAGPIFLIQIPVMTEGKQLVNKLTDIWRPLKYEGLYDASILRISPDNRYVLEEISVCHFSAILLDLEEAIGYCFENNLCTGGKFKELCLHVFYIHETFPGSLTLFSGDREELNAYSILLKREGDIELKEALNSISGALVKYGSRNDN